MIQQLVQLLLSPWRAGLSAHIVQDEHRGIAYKFKELIIGHFTARAEGRAQVVKEVGSGDIESGAVVLDAVIGNGGGKVGLAGAGGTSQDQPTSGLVSKCSGGFISAVELLLFNRAVTFTLRVQIVKGETSQRAEIAVSLQNGLVFRFRFVFGATAGDNLTKIGFS